MKEEFTIDKITKLSVDEYLKNFNKKAHKLNCKPFSLNVINKRINPHTYEEIYDVELIGDIPKLGNWEVVGYSERSAKGSKILIDKLNSDVEIPDKYYNELQCEHCNIKRFRSKIFIVKNIKTDEIKSVGSSCVKDFTGHNPSIILKLLNGYKTLLKEIYDEENRFGSNRRPIFYTVEFVAKTLKHLETHFFVARNSQNDKQPTANIIIESYYTHNQEEKIYPEKKHFEKANEIVEYFKNIKPYNDYLFKLNTFANEGIFYLKHAGYVASMIPTYQRAMKKLNEQKLNEQKLNKNNSNYIGTIGEKFEFDVELKSKKIIETYFGISELLTFEDEDQNIIKYFYSGSYNFIEGKKYNFIATIKDHSEYKGMKQTMITRTNKIKELE